jgi:hypothetical protein
VSGIGGDDGRGCTCYKHHEDSEDERRDQEQYRCLDRCGEVGCSGLGDFVDQGLPWQRQRVLRSDEVVEIYDRKDALAAGITSRKAGIDKLAA